MDAHARIFHSPIKEIGWGGALLKQQLLHPETLATMISTLVDDEDGEPASEPTVPWYDRVAGEVRHAAGQLQRGPDDDAEDRVHVKHVYIYIYVNVHAFVQDGGDDRLLVCQWAWGF